ncbi:YciI family protein [bacterium]|nr:YciI family protein [bacterium]
MPLNWVRTFPGPQESGAKQQFAILYRPARADFSEGQTGRESGAIAEHSAYLRGLLDAGVLKLAGRCEDTSLGLALIQSESEEQARRIMEADPAVQAGVFLASLKVWRTALLAGQW